MDRIDHIDADRYSPLDVPLLFVDAATYRAGVALQAVVIGIDPDGALPDIAADAFDLLLTTRPEAPAPWVFIETARWAQALDYIDAAVRRTPVAATTLARTLRLTEQLPVDDGLGVESFAYSMLLGGAEFRRWRGLRAPAAAPDAGGAAEPVRWQRDGDHVTLTLDVPGTRNATTAALRDALYAALANCLDDPSRPRVTLRGAGKCFSTGGHLDEFGSAIDLAAAHVARMLHSCTRAMFALGSRTDVALHGACIGSGLEIAAAAARRTAAPDTWFQLPELRMGLIPGAGGTVSVARVIGRHRTAWLVLTGARLGVRRALDWGLIDAIDETT